MESSKPNVTAAARLGTVRITMNEHPTAQLAPDLAGALPRPWGFWSTLGFALVAFLFAHIVVGGLVWWMSWTRPGDALSEALEDPALPLLLIATNLFLILMLAGAARLAGWPAAAYLGLAWPTRRDVVASIIGLLAVMLILELLTYLSGRASVTPFQTDAYRAAKTAGTLPIMWLAFVVAAPGGEEILFRGFVFRGWAASPLRASGTIAVTSLIFAAVHLQYDWFGIFQVFCLSALFGWTRWRSGSTTLTILLHMAINFVSTLWTAARVEGWA
jgi:membrane protease YdiL (CAAX protease family)